MPSFKIAGGDVHYLDLGAGPTLVLLHGWPVSSVYWRADAVRLSGRFRVLAVDLPGFGRSFAPEEEGCGIEQQADRVAELIRGVVGGPVALVGHSMGGMIAAALARRHPVLVSRLVLVAAPLEGTSGLSALGMLGRFWLVRFFVTFALSFAAVRRAAAARFAFAARIPEDILEAAGEASPACARLALEAITSENTRYELRQIRCPTLIIAADRDSVVSAYQPLIGKAWIPGARIEVFPDCGHCPNIEYPALFDRTLVEFLGLGASGRSTTPPGAVAEAA